MSSNISKKEDSRPEYVSPRVIRLDDVYSGAGGKCSIGSAVAAGGCSNGAGAGLTCEGGNGATVPCSIGNGDNRTR